MKTKNNFKVVVSEIDRITGSSIWESTIEDLKSWELSDEDIEDIRNGRAVKCYSPNGRRVIDIKKANK